MFYILRTIAEFFSYFLAINAFIAKKNVSLSDRLANFMSSFGAVLDDDEDA